MGEAEEAKKILNKIVENRSSMADDVRESIYLTLGNLAISDGKIDEALGYLEKSLDVADGDDVSALVQTKKSIAMAHLEAGQTDRAISTLDGILEDLSDSGLEGKSVNLLKAEMWNYLSRVYGKKDDLAQAQHFSKLGESFLYFLIPMAYILSNLHPRLLSIYSVANTQGRVG